MKVRVLPVPFWNRACAFMVNLIWPDSFRLQLQCTRCGTAVSDPESHEKYFHPDEDSAA